MCIYLLGTDKYHFLQNVSVVSTGLRIQIDTKRKVTPTALHRCNCLMFRNKRSLVLHRQTDGLKDSH